MRSLERIRTSAGAPTRAPCGSPALLREPLQQRVEVADGQRLRPLDALRLRAVRLAHEVDRLALRLEAAPHVTGAAAGSTQVEHGIGGRLGLVGDPLAEAVERDPGGGDALHREHARAQRLLARQRLHIAEPRAVEDGHGVVGDREPRRHRRLARLVEQALGFLAHPERAAATAVRPRLDHGALRDAPAAPHHLVAVGHAVEARHRSERRRARHGTRTKPSISRRAVRYTVTRSAHGAPSRVATFASSGSTPEAWPSRTSPSCRRATSCTRVPSMRAATARHMAEVSGNARWQLPMEIARASTSYSSAAWRTPSRAT